MQTVVICAVETGAFSPSTIRWRHTPVIILTRMGVVRNRGDIFVIPVEGNRGAAFRSNTAIDIDFILKVVALLVKPISVSQTDCSRRVLVWFEGV